MRSGRASGLLPVSLLAISAMAPEAPPPGAVRVGREVLLEAMRGSRGFDLSATANGPRLQAAVIFRIVREAGVRDAERRPLFIDHLDWYEVLLQRLERSRDQAPLYARLAYENRQDTVIDYREERVVLRVERGPRPRAALNVTTGWGDAPGRPRRYSYDDDKAEPHLRVTCDRVLRYRLLDFGDFILFDEVEGLHGRPTSGVLGALFSLIGEATVVESRTAIAADGTQVSRGRGHKGPFHVTATVTVHPDGRGEKGLPAGRPDLAALENLLMRPLEIVYVPWPP